MRHFTHVDQFEPKAFLDLAKRGLYLKENPGDVKQNGLSVVNMFYESSTRTKVSFELAERKMAFHVMNFDVSTSSVNKGESLYDSVLTMKAIGMDVAVIRHQNSEFYKNLCDIGISIVNGGSGSDEHPSQCLLDLMTILEQFEDVRGLKLAIVGDLKHSRVASSNARLLHKLGVELYFCGPEKYFSESYAQYGTFAKLDDIIETLDVVMMLRLQLERHKKNHTFTEAQYLREYGLNNERYQRMKDKAIIMHPAPVNRDVEIQSELVECEKSRIVKQIENGVYARMAILEWVKG